MPINWKPKVLGIMQSAADKTLQITFFADSDKVTISAGSIGEPVAFTEAEFLILTVHEILNKAGVSIDENAGK